MGARKQGILLGNASRRPLEGICEDMKALAEDGRQINAQKSGHHAASAKKQHRGPPGDEPDWPASQQTNGRPSEVRRRLNVNS